MLLLRIILQHNQVVRILNFLYICTNQENLANEQAVNKFVGCKTLTTTTLFKNTALQQPVKVFDK